jgi:hypothetical protein
LVPKPQAGRLKIDQPTDLPLRQGSRQWVFRRFPVKIHP